MHISIRDLKRIVTEAVRKHERYDAMMEHGS
jgi:hypothetical protein